MAQTKEGAIKTRQTLIKKYGGEQGMRDFMRSIGARGGAASGEGGFRKSMCNGCELIQGTHKKAECAGKKGGMISKRKPAQK